MTTDRPAPTTATPDPAVPGDLAVDLAVGLAPQAAPACVGEPVDTGCADGCCATTAPTVVRDDAWHRAARNAVWLSWASLGWMTVEGAVGLLAGFRAGSTGLVGWALSSVVEGLASIIVIWRLTGTRTLSDAAERTAQRAVAVSFWLLAPYVAVQATHDLLTGSHPSASPVGIAVTVNSILVMPALGRAKHRLGARLGSIATAGEGTQNLLCAYLAAAVLAGLVANAALGAWWLDPLAGLAVAAVAVKEGRGAWRGEQCC